MKKSKLTKRKPAKVGIISGFREAEYCQDDDDDDLSSELEAVPVRSKKVIDSAAKNAVYRSTERCSSHHVLRSIETGKLYSESLHRVSYYC